MRQFQHVNDIRDDKKIGMGIAALVGLGVSIFLGFGGLAGVVVALVCAGLYRGRVISVQSDDPTVRIKDHYRTPGVWRTAGFGFALACVLSFANGSGARSLILLALAFVCLMVARRDGGGLFPMPSFMRRPNEPETPEQAIAYRVSKQIFVNAGLTWKSPESGIVVYPEIREVFLDERERVAIEVDVISGRQTVEDFQKRAGQIASAWDVPRVVVSEPIPHVARITAILKETVVDSVDWSPVPVVPVVDYVRNLPMGANTETGDPWVLNLAERNFVISGQPNSGKSSFSNALLAHLSRHPDVRLAFIDMKLGAEAAPWRERADQIIHNTPRDDGRGVEDAIDFIADAVADMGERYGRMIDAGVTNAWTEGFLGPDEPVKVLVIDECSRLFRADSREHQERADRVLGALQEYVEQGRAAGYVLLISTQYPTTENLPTRIRNNVSDKIAFRSSTQGMYATLGSSYVPENTAGDPTQITNAQQGQAVIVGDDGEARRIQMAWIDKETKLQVVSDTATLKRTWLDEPPPQIEQAAPDAQTAELPGPISDELDDILSDVKMPDEEDTSTETAANQESVAKRPENPWTI